MYFDFCFDCPQLFQRIFRIEPVRNENDRSTGRQARGKRRRASRRGVHSLVRNESEGDN